MKCTLLITGLLLMSSASAVTFTNPMLHMDFSDPDVCVGRNGKVYLTASSFGCIPGLPILMSDDLVNWSYVGHALRKQPYAEGIGSPEHGKSVYAPSLRYHAQKDEYVIYWGDPDRGIYRVAAKDPSGPWSEPRLILAERGIIDTCPLYDDDGRIYLINGWAGSRVGIGNQLTVRELDADSARPISDPVMVFDGGAHDFIVVEGPKLYKKDGEYWIWAPGGGVGGGYQIAARSNSIFGPYEAKKILERGKTPINGPHQGGVVKAADGKNYFIHFSDRGAYGRILYLEPMTWAKGAWPVVGNDGEPVASFVMPLAKEQKKFGGLATSDEFNTTTLGPQWQFLGRTAESRAWPTPYGYLRMLSTDTTNVLWETPNVMVQKFPALQFTATMKASVKPRKRGDEFGICVMGGRNARLGLRYQVPKNAAAGSYEVVYVVGDKADTKASLTEETTVLGTLEAPDPGKYFAPDVYFRVAVTPGKAHPAKPLAPAPVCTFGWSTDGKNWTTCDKTFNATCGVWIGATIGMYAISPSCINRPGQMDVDWFRID